LALARAGLDIYFGHKVALKMPEGKGGETALDGLEFFARAFTSGKYRFMPAVLPRQSVLDRPGR